MTLGHNQRLITFSSDLVWMSRFIIQYLRLILLELFLITRQEFKNLLKRLKAVA